MQSPFSPFPPIPSSLQQKLTRVHELLRGGIGCLLLTLGFVVGSTVLLLTIILAVRLILVVALSTWT